MFSLRAQTHDAERLRALLGEVEVEVESSSVPSSMERSSAELSGQTPLIEKLFPLQRFIWAGLDVHQRHRYGVFLAVVTLISLAAVVLVRNPLVGIVPLFLYFMQFQLLDMKSNARQADFDKDYAALLLSLSSGLKTGLDPLIALSRSTVLFQPDSVLRGELEGFKKSLDEGATEDRAIDTFGSTVRHPDIKLFRMAFKLARKEGASLSACLQRLARVTRQRQSFRRKTRGAVAMQKLSAFGIAGCTALIGVIQGVSNKQAFVDAFAHPIGRGLLLLGLGLVVSGIVWMLSMAKLKV
jgi:Flp pilus assembly protein TadB